MKRKYILDAIETNSTLTNAKEWAATDEKFTYCIDVLGINARDNNSDYWVEMLEDAFEDLIVDAVITKVFG